MVMILAAMAGEIRRLAESAEALRLGDIQGFPHWEGKFGDHSVLFGVTGAGKSLASLMTGRYLDRFAPEAVFYIGIAGALNPLYRPGDILTARDCIHHDIDLTPLGLPRGQIPGRHERVFPADPGLLKAAGEYRPRGFRLWTGRILTGDRFVVTADPFFETLRGDAVDMEGASAALAASLAGTPFLLIRMISDQVGQNLPTGLGKMMRRSAERCGALVTHLLETHPPSTAPYPHNSAQ